MHIGLNAHLLSQDAGYRAAGIHSYIVNLMSHLTDEAPPDWRFTAMVNAGWMRQFPRIALRNSRWSTTSPVRRILWEQAAQPFQLRGFDGYHALAFIAPALLMRPSVVTMYDLSFVHFPERLPAARRLYLQWFSRLTCRRARRVIAISQATARDLTATWGIPADKIDIAAPGFDAAVFRPLPETDKVSFRAHMNLPERFWLFIGTLEPRKNLVTLLEGYAALRPGDRLPLVIGGGKGWGYEPVFEAVKRLNLAADVRFIGFVPSDELPLWYNTAEAFLYPSVFEGFGLPVLEAMACGTPVVVSNASSLIEIAEGTGMLVEPSQPTAWTDALARVLTDDGWRQSARENGFTRAAQYSWQQTARQTILSYTHAFDST